MESSVMTLPATQAELPIQDPISMGIIRRCRSMGAAIQLAIQVSGKCQKAVSMDLEIDQGQWSRIMASKAHFPHDRLDRLCDVVGNDIPLQWWADQRGYELRRKVSALERQVEELQQKLQLAALREQVLKEAISGR